MFLTLNFWGVITIPARRLPDLAHDANCFELIDDVKDGCWDFFWFACTVTSDTFYPWIIFVFSTFIEAMLPP